MSSRKDAAVVEHMGVSKNQGPTIDPEFSHASGEIVGALLMSMPTKKEPKSVETAIVYIHIYICIYVCI